MLVQYFASNIVHKMLENISKLYENYHFALLEYFYNSLEFSYLKYLIRVFSRLQAIKHHNVLHS